MRIIYGFFALIILAFDVLMATGVIASFMDLWNGRFTRAHAQVTDAQVVQDRHFTLIIFLVCIALMAFLTWVIIKLIEQMRKPQEDAAST